jgi:hypothetical protein
MVTILFKIIMYLIIIIIIIIKCFFMVKKVNNIYIYIYIYIYILAEKSFVQFIIVGAPSLASPK